jgi:phosphatidylglycerophosphate synthase
MKFLLLPPDPGLTVQEKILGLYPRDRLNKTLIQKGLIPFEIEKIDPSDSLFVLRDNLFITKHGLEKILERLAPLSRAPDRIEGTDGIMLGVHAPEPETLKKERNFQKLADISHSGTGEQADVLILDESDYIVFNSEQAYRSGRKYLLDSLRRSHDGLISRTINRPVSLFVSGYLAETSVTPNQITVMVFILSLVCALCMGMGYFIMGTILMHISSILDGCDGEVARLKFMQSKLGAWLDTILDDIANQIFFCATGIGLYLENPVPLYLVLTVIIPVFSVPSFTYLYSKLIRLGKTDTGELKIDQTSFTGRIINILKMIIKKDFYYAAFVVIATAGFPQFILFFAAAGSVSGAIGIFLEGKKMK